MFVIQFGTRLKGSPDWLWEVPESITCPCVLTRTSDGIEISKVGMRGFFSQVAELSPIPFDPNEELGCSLQEKADSVCRAVLGKYKIDLTSFETSLIRTALEWEIVSPIIWKLCDALNQRPGPRDLWMRLIDYR